MVMEKYSNRALDKVHCCYLYFDEGNLQVIDVMKPGVKYSLLEYINSEILW